MQITAFGADDVPDVKISAHRDADVGLEPGSSVDDAASSAPSQVVVGEHVRQPRLRSASSKARCRSSVTTSPTWVCSMSRQQVLVAPGVVQADDHRAGQRRAAEREEVLGGVVEQHTDVQHAVRRARSVCEEEVGPPDRLGEILGVGPRAGPRNGSAGRAGDLRVASRCGAAARPRSARGAGPARARARCGHSSEAAAYRLVPDACQA